MPQPQQRSSQASQSQKPPFQAARHQTAPSPQQQASPHSSQAQNSHTSDEEENMSDTEAPVEPNLAQEQLEALNMLLAQPCLNRHITVLDPDLPPETTWFGFDHSFMTRQITKIFTNKFDGPYYSWLCVPREREE